ncbi:UNVERIFIED_CONTAM: hypothetical protein K2H54_049853 [Gekko kuhli]
MPSTGYVTDENLNQHQAFNIFAPIKILSELFSSFRSDGAVKGRCFWNVLCQGTALWYSCRVVELPALKATTLELLRHRAETGPHLRAGVPPWRKLPSYAAGSSPPKSPSATTFG